MTPRESRHSTTWMLSVQGDLSLQIGVSLDASRMLHHFLRALTRRLQLRAAQLWWRDDAGAPERFAYPARSLVSWAAEPAREAAGMAFLAGAESAADDGVLRLRVGDVAVLFLEEGRVRCSPGALAVVDALMPRLAFACRACLDHRRSGALLDLTRRQNQELQETRLRAEEALRSKNEFLAAISHEMRTPLNSVLGFAELLRLELAGEEMEEYAKTIYSSGRHLLAMFNDLLDLAKLDARRLVLYPEDIDLAQLCTDAWAPMAADARRKGLIGRLEFAPGLPARIVVDPVRLRQILGNLLGNALKFTRAGSVSFTVMPREGAVEFVIADTGPGIRPEAKDKVFERFVQAGDGHLRNAEGTGLGLAIASELAEAMGGSLGLESELGRGSCFHLFLPEVDPTLIRGAAPA
ncbi:MAG: ATP-binding protein [Candidatus Dactylopiibacterium sp.]|nr:ATP-binding protein [Candidatus Dactylopiibacterium sp.]